MSHHVASNADRGTDLIDPEHGLYLLATGRGDAGSLGPSKLSWAVEGAAADLRSRVVDYQNAPSGPSRRAVMGALDEVLHGTGPEFLQGRTPDGRPGVSFILVLVGPGFAFVAHRGESRLDVVRDGKVHRITPPDGEAKISHLDLLPGDRLVLSSRGFPKGARPPDEVHGTLEQAANALLPLAAAEAPRSTVVVVDPPASAEGDALLARATALGRLFLFDELSFESRLLVNGICHRQVIGPRQDVVREGETGDAMYVVVGGHLAVTVQGRELGRLAPGGHFGELALAEDTRRPATVTALDNALVVEISRGDLLDFARNHPAEGLQIAWRLVRFLGHRLRDLGGEIVDP